jgi:hypothetical protein
MNLKNTFFFLFISLKIISQNNLKDSTVTLYLDSLQEFKIETAYFVSGKIKTEKTYFGDKMIRIVYFSKDGNPLIESNYNLNDDEFGWQKEYYNNGKIKKEKYIIDYTLIKEKYKNEIYTVKVFNGQYREYFENGVLQKEGYIVNGKKRGLQINYDSTGKIIKINYYKALLKGSK